MQRYFASVREGKAHLDEGDARHLTLVMRAKKGQVIEVADEGELYSAHVESLEPLSVAVDSRIERDVELKAHLLLAFAHLKGGHDDLVLQKGTELGVYRFLPYLSERTIVRIESEKDALKKKERAEKIVKESCQQCKRAVVPSVMKTASFKEILETEATYRLIAYENESEDTDTYRETLRKVKEGESLLILIGPEGGFSPKEVETAKAKGFVSVGLGKRILRAETASIYAASTFGYEVER